ncbi:MAG: MFS transporter [Syntrophobacteraceae bacterium]
MDQDHNQIPGTGTLGARLFFRALKSRNYRLFFMGQGISLIGTWTQQVAMSWLVYRLTGSTILLGSVAFCNQIPIFFLSPLAGVIVDRLERKRLILCTQALSMLQALALAALVLTHAVAVWHILALSLFIGVVNAFDMPTRQSFVIQMIEKKEDLGNAIALNSAMFNGARFIGPSVAGILIAGLGEGICFLINGLSYIAVLAALLAIRVEPRGNGYGRKNFRRELLDGIAYAYNFKPILAILALLSIFSLAGGPYIVLMPVFAKDVLHGGAQTFGFLMSAAGVGALASTVYLSARRTAQGLVKMIPLATVLFSFGITVFALSRCFQLSLAALCLAGFGMLAQIASSNTIIQTVVDEDKRGRVMSLYTASFLGTMPFGNLLAGGAAEVIGVQRTLLAGAAICLLGGVIFACKLSRLQAMLNPAFEKLGTTSEESPGKGVSASARKEG